MQLTQQQQYVLEQIKFFLNSDCSVFILRGYAGTGKTTMIKQIADYISNTKDIVLMAPTGRAARVLQTKTGREANTIHKAIYGSIVLRIAEVKEVAESEFKLIFPIKSLGGKIVAIVDEASMLCSRTMEQELFQFGTDNLMDDLLTYIRPLSGGKVIFVGDPAQLPPVGDIFSQALRRDYFESKGLKVMEAELTEVVRQSSDSVILKNAMQIRHLLEKTKRNHLVFEERKGEVASLQSGGLLHEYFEERRKTGRNSSVVICYSNQAAMKYNREIRSALYGEENPELRQGDTLLVVQNNYYLDRMNGEFIEVLAIGDKFTQSAPVYVQEAGVKVRKIFTFDFVEIKIPDAEGVPVSCLLLLNLLNNGKPALDIDEQRALYINFCMRNPRLRQGTREFVNAINEDPFYTCLKAKYGYAVTGHKCQGGEWENVFVDYSGRTGLSDDCLRWAYTATTRASQTLFITNLPHITPYSKFRIEPIQQCSKMNEECRVLGEAEQSPFHEQFQPDYLHAKCSCIIKNMEFTPYKINCVISKPYQEIYHIETPEGIERYDLRYKKGGIFLKAIPQVVSKHTSTISLLLNSEHAMPLIFNYVPEDESRASLYNMIKSVCDGLRIQITNIVNHDEDYSVVYYFRTSFTFSYIKIYIDNKGYITYAKPLSLIGTDDNELVSLIEEIYNHFE